MALCITVRVVVTVQHRPSVHPLPGLDTHVVIVAQWRHTFKRTGLTGRTGTLETVEWLNASEVSALFVQAGLFRIPRSTLRRWTLAGRITSVRIAGGHRRYKGAEARARIAEMSKPAEAVA